MEKSKTRWKVVVIRGIRIAILLAVVLGVYWAVRRSLSEMERHEFDWRSLDWGSVLAAMAAYTLGMLPCWWYWHQTLVSLGQSPRYRESLPAFFIGQLGKYVPGKATVVALRADWVSSERTRVSVAAASVFVETLTMMAVGAWVATTYLLFWRPADPSALPLSPHTLRLLAFVLTLVAAIPILPPVFRRLVILIGVQRADPGIETALQGLTLGLLTRGLFLNLVAWGCWGTSLWLVLRSLPEAAPGLQELPLLVACVALAMVAGFLSLIPGGLGVRELVILSLLQPFGATVSVVSAVVLRLVWLMSELLLATILYLGTWRGAHRR